MAIAITVVLLVRVIRPAPTLLLFVMTSCRMFPSTAATTNAAAIVIIIIATIVIVGVLEHVFATTARPCIHNVNILIGG